MSIGWLMFILPQKVDIRQCDWHFRFGPLAIVFFFALVDPHQGALPSKGL